MNVPPLRERLRQSTRDAILESAANAFKSGDVGAARMEDIAAGAGIAVGTLYNYFRDRQALVSAVLQSRTEGLLDALDQVVHEAAAAPGGPSQGFADDLHRFVAVLTLHCDEHRVLMLSLIDEGLQHGIDATAAHRQQTVATQLMARAGRLLARGVATGALRRAEPSLYAAMLLGMVRAVAMTALVRGDAGLGGRADDIVGVFLGGAAAAPRSARSAEEVSLTS